MVGIAQTAQSLSTIRRFHQADRWPSNSPSSHSTAVRSKSGARSISVEVRVPVTINYFWQVVTDEYIIGYLTASLTYQGVTCTVHRPYEMRYTG